jgi:glyoxylase-like metal-dependent hydrolase (beta-lactamase superfamily II)
MGLQIKALHLGDVALDWSRLAIDFNQGKKTWVPVNSFLILGSETPILVDNGFDKAETMDKFGMRGCETPDQDIIKLIRKQGVGPEDIGYIIHTHMHVDHCGKNELFPNAKIVVQRKEMGFAAGELKPYHCIYLPWFISNLDRMEFLDGDFELFPGIKCVLAEGHTGGHQHVEVESEQGKAIICGDNVYDIPIQLEGRHPTGRLWPIGSYYHLGVLMRELYKLKKENERGTLILPSHGYEVYDRYKLGERFGDKRRDYEGFSSYEWPPK